MLWVLALSAVINVVLGYALAVYLAGASAACAAAAVGAEAPLVCGLPPAQAQSQANGDSSSPEEAILGALRQIQQEAEAYHGRLTETDQKLRDGTGSADEFSAILKEVLGAAEGYARQRDTAHAVVTQLQESCPAMQTLCAGLDSAIEQEDSRILRARELASDCESAGLAEDQGVSWLGVVGEMLDAGAAVRQQVGAALAVMGDCLPAGSPQANRPAMDRTAAENRIARWQDASASETRPLCVALVDLDRVGDLNRRHGLETMDRVLAALAGWLAEERPGDAGDRFTGERFLLFFPEQTLRETFEPIERLRQSIERTRFRSGGEDIQLTACCAIAEASQGESPQELLGRVETTLAEAKRAGRNRTFVHQSGVDSPLIPMELSVEERQLVIG